MKVKICGVTRAEDARLACALGAWAVGLIFVPGSARALDLAAARRLRPAIAPGTLAIGVFADADAAFIRAAVSGCALDAVQLHGSETPQVCAEAGAPVYKGLPFAGPSDLQTLRPYRGRVAGFLLETVRRLSSGRERVGPRERESRWRLARRAARAETVLLAGELTPENVAAAVRAARPAGVDVCGGVESEPGRKDPAKLEALFKAIRSAEGE